jgi:hypothetical protein
MGINETRREQVNEIEHEEEGKKQTGKVDVQNGKYEKNKQRDRRWTHNDKNFESEAERGARR